MPGVKVRLERGPDDTLEVGLKGGAEWPQRPHRFLNSQNLGFWDSYRASAGFAEVRAQLLRISSALDTARLPLGLTGISASVSSLLGQLLLARPQLPIVGALLRVWRGKVDVSLSFGSSCGPTSLWSRWVYKTQVYDHILTIQSEEAAGWRPLFLSSLSSQWVLSTELFNPLWAGLSFHMSL